MSLAVTIRELLAHREQLVAEIAAITADVAAIDADVAEARAALGVSVPDAILKACAVCRESFVPTSPRQRMCDLCRENAPHRSVEEITDAVAPDSTCERCHAPFVRGTNTAGKFCSRACYAPQEVETRKALIVKTLGERGPTGCAALARLPAFVDISRGTVANDLQKLRRLGVVVSADDGWRLTARAAPVAQAAVQIERPVETPLLKMHDVDPAHLPKRRCARCFNEFQPAAADRYSCDGCIGKARRRPKADPDEELETIWRPGKDAAPLTTNEGVGSSLGGVHVLRS